MSTVEKKQSLPEGRYYRMVRKGNGFVLQELTIRKTVVSLKEVGDWDYRGNIEAKALRAIANASRD